AVKYKYCDKMSDNIKKTSFCDYCKNEKDANQVFTSRKNFLGHRIIDILEVVTKVKIPANMPLKLCTMCTSTLHFTSGVVDRARAMITTLSPMSKIQKAAIIHKPIKSASDSESEEAVEPQTSKGNSNSPLKNMAALNGTSNVVKKNLDKTGKQQQNLITASPSKLDESLKNVIKLMPANEANPNKSKAFTQLFGNSVNHISDSEYSSEDDEEVRAEIKNKKNIAIHFECKLCDFTSTYPNPMRRHLKDLHGQKRPRIYNCLKCSKTFGVLKTLKIHLLTHGVTEDKGKDQVNEKGKNNEQGNEKGKNNEQGNEKGKNNEKPDSQLAVLTALKPQPKPKPLGNTELTFAIQDTNSSTPKPAETFSQLSQPYQCEYCKELHKSLKSIQKHLQLVHNIEKPKLFKCIQCEAPFMHKTTLDRHIKVKHGEGQDTNPKAPRRRKTIDERAILATKAEGNEGAQKQTPFGKIAARRKTVDVSIALADLPTTSRKLSIAFDGIDDIYPKNPKQPTEVIKESKSPKKKAKADKENTVSVPLDLSGPISEEPAAASPSKKPKHKKEIDITAAAQIIPLNTETPTKTKVKKALDVLDSPLGNNVIIELLDEINVNPLPHRREMRESVSQESIDTDLYNCNQCSKVVNSRKRLDSHIKKKHMPLLKCIKCQKIYVESNDYISHFATCTGSEGLTCGVEDCDKVFAAANFLSSHLKKRH
ncbi:hypothetical protein KR093_011348, partial [Drosophila rubida]